MLLFYFIDRTGNVIFYMEDMEQEETYLYSSVREVNVFYFHFHMQINVYLHVVDMEVLLNDGCGLLAQFILVQGRLGGTLGRWGGDSCLPLHCSQIKTKNKLNSIGEI